MNWKGWSIFVLLGLCIWQPIQGQVSYPNTIHSFYTKEEITLDGDLGEAIWQKAQRISNFTQRELFFGQPSTERTEVALAYNDNHLYVAVWCYDSEPDKLIARELKRDFDYQLDDNFILIIDTYGDKRNGFMFVTNPIAARADLQVFNNGGSSNAFWNGVWNVKTRVTSEGWFAEFEIPFYTFKYDQHIAEPSWGINFERNIRRKREQVLWQGWSRDNRIEQVNQAGTITGLKNLRNKQFVEIKPYALGGAEFVPNSERGVGNLGGEVNYLLSPTYRLNVTLNTDFAQVEADQQQINITRFPLFFPELREFFLEGNDFFDMGFGGNRIIPFYTRRIGLNANRNTVPIIGGARLLGKSSNSTLGLMSLQTAADETQPSTNYTTASWRQDVGKQSVIGAMTTNTFNANGWHSTTGINGRFSTSKFLGKRNLDIGGAYIQTYNSAVGFKPQSFAYRAFVSYPNDKWSLFASTQRAPQNFNPEVGLLLRRSFRESFIDLTLKPRPKTKLMWIRQYQFKPVNITYTQFDNTGDIQTFEYRLRYFGIQTRSGENVYLDYRIQAEGLLDSFQIHPNAIIPAGTFWWNQYDAAFETFRGRKLSATANISWGEFFTGTSTQTRSTLLWRTSKYLNLSLRYEKNIVSLPYGSFQTDLIGNRIEYAFNPNLFGSLLSQWNSAQNELNFNFRLQVIPKIGTDFFLIVNQIYDTKQNTLIAKRGTVLAKLIWRFTV